MMSSGVALEVRLSVSTDSWCNPSYCKPTLVTHPHTPDIFQQTVHVSNLAGVNIENKCSTKLSLTDRPYNWQLQK